MQMEYDTCRCSGFFRFIFSHFDVAFFVMLFCKKHLTQNWLNQRASAFFFSFVRFLLLHFCDVLSWFWAFTVFAFRMGMKREREKKVMHPELCELFAKFRFYVNISFFFFSFILSHFLSLHSKMKYTESTISHLHQLLRIILTIKFAIRENW